MTTTEQTDPHVVSMLKMYGGTENLKPIHNKEKEAEDNAYSAMYSSLYSGESSTNSSSSLDNNKNFTKRVDWNLEWQTAMEASEDNLEELDQKYRQLVKLATDFISIVKNYGKVILSEIFIDESEKTLPTAKLGGIAGGIKYSVQGILFKLARDSPISQDGARANFLYGGTSGYSFEYANKAAGNELRAASQYAKYHSLLRIPMSALLDYNGFRMVVMPFLPIGRIEVSGFKTCNTLVYGSADGGKTVKNASPGANDCMANMASDLHLASHPIANSNIVLHSAGDCEVHKGRDNRLYLCDLGRAFPCESPKITEYLKQSNQSIFYRQLRPEFLQILKKRGLPRLSPDAFSLWGQQKQDEFNNDVTEATRILIEEIIPSFVNELLNLDDIMKKFISVPNEVLHKRGINIRHLGKIRSLIINNHNDDDDDNTSKQKDELEFRILHEMASRTAKNMLRKKLRETHGKRPSEYACRSIVCHFFNELTGAEAGNHIYQQIIDGICDRFGEIALLNMTHSDGKHEYLYDQLRKYNLIPLLIMKIANACGIQISELTYQALSEKPTIFRFVNGDIEIGVRIKQQPFVDYVEGRRVFLTLPHGVSPDAPRILTTSKKFFSRAYNSDPNFVEAKQFLDLNTVLLESVLANRNDKYEIADKILINAAKRYINEKFPWGAEICLGKSILMVYWNSIKTIAIPEWGMIARPDTLLPFAGASNADALLEVTHLIRTHLPDLLPELCFILGITNSTDYNSIQSAIQNATEKNWPARVEALQQFIGT